MAVRTCDEQALEERARRHPKESLWLPPPHYLARPQAGGKHPPTNLSQPIKLHTDDWMHVELARGDYVLACLVALVVATAVGSLTVLPATLVLQGQATSGSGIWPLLIWSVPLSCGLAGAWSCLRRARQDRLRQQLHDELRS